MNPKVSVIIPVYNREALLPRAVNSVLSQSYKNWELFIVDDCSTDNTVKVASRFTDNRIRLLQTKTNSGPATARNLGIQNSRGEYIALLDSDDIYHQTFLERVYMVISNLTIEYGFTYTGVGDIKSAVTEVKKADKLWRLPEKFLRYKRPYLYQLQIGTAAGITFKKSVFEKIGYFDQALEAAEDTDFFIRASEHTQGYPISEILIFKDHETNDRLTSNYLKLSEAYKIIIDKNIDLIEADIYLARRWFSKLMWLNFYSGNKKIAKKSFWHLYNLERGVTFKIFFILLAGLLLPRNLFIALHKKLNKALK